MEVLSAIKQNRDLINSVFSGDKDLEKIRDELRKETGIRARGEEDYIIATGHQPVPYYPGLLFKNYFTGKHAKLLSGKAYNFVVDTDQNEIEVPVPCAHEDKYCKEVVSVKKDAETVFTGFHPGNHKVYNFLDSIEERIKTLEQEGFLSSFKNWKNQFLEEFDGKNFIDTLTKQRSKFEKTLGIDIENIKISEIVDTKVYYQFVCYILDRLEDFRRVYNEAVEKYSRGNYQPVRYIHKEDGWFEVPFWLIKDNKRYTLKLKKESSRWVFFSEKADISFNIEYPGDDVAGQIKKNVILYPKATTLTLMLRLFFADLFVHGTGAVEYEKVNNEFIKNFFNLEKKPLFYGVSGDIYLPLLESNPDYYSLKKQHETKRKWLKEASRNPEDLLEEKIANNYKERKKQLSSLLRQSDSANDRKQIHRQLEMLNDEMKYLLKDRSEEIEEEYEKLSEVLENKHIYFERRYPYFIYPFGHLSVDKFENNLSIEAYS
jgi:hypothetical protein